MKYHTENPCIYLPSETKYAATASLELLTNHYIRLWSINLSGVINGVDLQETSFSRYDSSSLKGFEII